MRPAFYPHIISLLLCVASVLQIASAQETFRVNIDALPDSLGTPLTAVSDTLTTVSPTSSRGPAVSPVDVDDHKPVTVMHYFDKHGNQLKEPVMFLATLDTVSTPKSRPIYPAFNGVSIAANFGDLLWMAFGNKYGSFDLQAKVSVFNWIFPTVEAGLGFADEHPKSEKFACHVKPSPYVRLGIDYNFVYKSNSDYQVFLGLRAGYSHFNYTLYDISKSSDLWEISNSGTLSHLLADCWWGEVLAGLKVKIAGCFSLGWDVRYKIPFRFPTDHGASPWFVPGFGIKDTPMSLSVCAIFTFGTRKLTSDHTITDTAKSVAN